MDVNTTSTVNYPLVDENNKRGQQLGFWLHKNKTWLLERIMILGALTMLILIVWKSFEAKPKCRKDKSLMENVSIYANAIRHSKCKGRGGCSLQCPFIDQDDPRVVIHSNAELITAATEELDAERKSRLESLEVGLMKITDDNARKAATSALTPVMSNMLRCVNNVDTAARLARNLDSKYGGRTDTNVEILNARNVASTLQAAVSVNLNAFLSASILGAATIMYQRIASTPAADQTRITNYESKLTSCKLYLNTIQSKHDVIMAMIADTPDVTNSYQGIIRAIAQEVPIQSQLANQYLAAMIGFGKGANDKFQTQMATYSAITEEYTTMMKKVESFSNGLPEGTIGSDAVSTLISDGDYNTALVRTALEPEIVKNHQKFAVERASFDSGGGVPAVRDDDNDIVSWIGLFGRPSYRRSDGTSMDRSGEPLRSIPSDNPTDLMRAATPRLSLR